MGTDLCWDIIPHPSRYQANTTLRGIMDYKCTEGFTLYMRRTHTQRPMGNTLTARKQQAHNGQTS
eukprot:5585459-Ditylum_brightwellii.AAC.1